MIPVIPHLESLRIVSKFAVLIQNYHYHPLDFCLHPVGFPHGGPFPPGHPAAGGPAQAGVLHRMPGPSPAAIGGFPPTARVSPNVAHKAGLGNDIFNELQQVIVASFSCPN